MDNRPQSVPISTLAGISPLVDVLPVLPLPKENNSVPGTEDDLAPLDVLSKGRNFLKNGIGNPSVLQRVAEHLNTVNTKFLNFKHDDYESHSLSSQVPAPPLLKQLLSTHPYALSDSDAFYGDMMSPIRNQNGLQGTSNTSPVKTSLKPPPLIRHPMSPISSQQSPHLNGIMSPRQLSRIAKSPEPILTHRPSEIVRPMTSVSKIRRRSDSEKRGQSLDHQIQQEQPPAKDILDVRRKLCDVERSQETALKYAVPEISMVNTSENIDLLTSLPEGLNPDKVHGTPDKPLMLSIPKLIVKRTKTRKGSKEYEKLEIVSPPPPEMQESHIGKDVLDEEIIPKRKKSKRRRSSGDEHKDHSKKKLKKIFSPKPHETTKADIERFENILETFIDLEEELEADGNLEYDHDGEIPQDALMPVTIISDFSVQIAKSKIDPNFVKVSVDKLMKVILVMNRHVKDSLTLNVAQQNAEDEEGKLWKTILFERINRSLEAACVTLNIITTPNMPKQVCLEEAIESIIVLCRFQLENTIYPEFDPVYKIHSEHGDSYPGGPKPKKLKGNIKSKPINNLYNKTCNLMSLLAQLVYMEVFPDTTILQISSIGTAPFFVENVNLLQLEALKLARAIFRKYSKHRDIILDDVLASVARLPSTKRNLRNYRLRNETSIQMFTALALQLVQSIVVVPDSFTITDESDLSKEDKDAAVIASYDEAVRTAQNFLSMFLKKCGSTSKDESDFRPLFENFLQDLLTTLNKPDWPSSELFLNVLGKLLVVTFSSKSNEMTLRCASVDYLALIASHLRRDVVNSRDKEQEEIKDIIEKIIDVEEPLQPINEDESSAFSQRLQKSLLICLSHFEQNDPSFKFSKEFFLAEWLKDIHLQIEKCVKKPMMTIPGAANFESATDAEDNSLEKIQLLDEKRSFVHSLVDAPKMSYRSSYSSLSYEEACVIVKYLASSRVFSQSFDVYLHQIFRILNENAIALRTKAVKALTQVVSVDSNILAREDVLATVHSRLRDQSTNVREAAVDLIGQFVLKCPELTHKYYDVIIERILDTGISVRKRVIKILRDICLEQPEFSKIPDICTRIIRRINDEEGVKELVAKVFLKIWFSPLDDITSQQGKERLNYRVQNISEVVSQCKDTGYEWFETLLDIILDVDEDAAKKTLLVASQQLVNCLLDKLMISEEQKGSGAIVGSLTTLYLLCKVRPQLLVPHVTTLQPYLSIKCNTQGDLLIVQNVAQILELVVPLIDHPSETFLAEIEEAMMKLILKQRQNVVQSCISCLASVINNVTHNYKFVVDCFQKFLGFLSKCYQDENNGKLDWKNARSPLQRSLFTISLLCKDFNFDEKIPLQNGLKASDRVFNLCLHFAKSDEEDVKLKALMAVGFIGMRCPELLLKQECKTLYQSVLTSSNTSVKEKCMILQNLRNHLVEEEAKLKREEPSESRKKKGKRKKKEEEINDIKEFGDSHSGTTSAVMQSLLKNILETFFHIEPRVRICALQVIESILRQGLIHPAQCVPYLIAISCDDEQITQLKSQQNLADIENRYSSFIQMKAIQGIKLSFKFRQLIKDSKSSIRGYRDQEHRVAMISQVYDMLKSNKQQRRSFLISVLKIVDDKNAALGLKHFIAENIAYLSFSTQEEALFVIHHIDVIASVSGGNLLHMFDELMSKSNPDEITNQKHDLNLMETDTMYEDVDIDELKRISKASFGCMILLEVKQFLKQLFGLQDSKCQKYSPSEPSKLYDKALNRKGYSIFSSIVTELLIQGTEVSRYQCVSFYREFRDVMMSLDTEHDSDSSNEKEQTIPIPVVTVRTSNSNDESTTTTTPLVPNLANTDNLTTPIMPKAKRKKHSHGSRSSKD